MPVRGPHGGLWPGSRRWHLGAAARPLTKSLTRDTRAWRPGRARTPCSGSSGCREEMTATGPLTAWSLRPAPRLGVWAGCGALPEAQGSPFLPSQDVGFPFSSKGARPCLQRSSREGTRGPSQPGPRGEQGAKGTTGKPPGTRRRTLSSPWLHFSVGQLQGRPRRTFSVPRLHAPNASSTPGTCATTSFVPSHAQTPPSPPSRAVLPRPLCPAPQRPTP